MPLLHSGTQRNHKDFSSDLPSNAVLVWHPTFFENYGCGCVWAVPDVWGEPGYGLGFGCLISGLSLFLFPLCSGETLFWLRSWDWGFGDIGNFSGRSSSCEQLNFFELIP